MHEALWRDGTGECACRRIYLLQFIWGLNHKHDKH